MMKTNHEGRILVIDDSTTNVVLLDAVLTKEGYQVETALNATEGLKLIRKKRPDLIFLDILMPVSSGFEFLETLRRDPSTKAIPVVIVSAVAEDEQKKRADELGAAEFIAKPVNIPSILRVVRKYVA